MKALVIIIIAGVLVGNALALWACCALVGKCCREEEKKDGK